MEALALHLGIVVICLLVLATVDMFDWYRALVRGVFLVVIVWQLILAIGWQQWRDLWNLLS